MDHFILQALANFTANVVPTSGECVKHRGTEGDDRRLDALRTSLPPSGDALRKSANAHRSQSVRTASPGPYRSHGVAHLPWEHPHETPATVPARCPEGCRFFATMTLARWPHVSTRSKRCGGAARTVRQGPAALPLVGLRCACGPAVCHGHGRDQCALRRAHVASPRMVVDEGLVAMAAEGQRHCRRC